MSRPAADPRTVWWKGPPLWGGSPADLQYVITRLRPGDCLNLCPSGRLTNRICRSPEARVGSALRRSEYLRARRVGGNEVWHSGGKLLGRSEVRRRGARRSAQRPRVQPQCLVSVCGGTKHCWLHDGKIESSTRTYTNTRTNARTPARARTHTPAVIAY